MHIGSFDDEPQTLKTIDEFIAANNLEKDLSEKRRHHEIYLNDPRKTPVEKLKTVLDDYLSFRHFIRNTYSYKIKWELMEDLILNIHESWNDIKNDIVNYIECC
jgi:hypothetical protein